MARACRALIDLDAIRCNLQLARRCAPQSRIMAVVKANAYGHGAVAVCGALDTADGFAVASIEEAVALRDAGIRQPILLLQGFFEAVELEELCGLALHTVVHTEEQLHTLLRASLPRPLSVWLKIDTGMHRLGFAADRVAAVLAQLQDCRQVADVVLMSHFASSDEPGNAFTSEQLLRFHEITAGFSLPRSIANSAAVLGWPDTSADWNRPGYMLYGNSPFGSADDRDYGLRPAMSLLSSVIALREVAAGESVGYGQNWRASRPSRVATASVGYGDGYPLQAPSGTPVLVNGQRARLVGRVSMDMITIDVTDLESIDIGAEVTLWGTGLSVNEVADHVGTLGYELLTRLPVRLPRVMVSSSPVDQH